MPYTHTNFSSLKTQLSLRLGDVNKRFWVDDELGVWLTEAMRTFGACSGFWRERGVFATTASTAFYDITTQLSGLIGSTVTDWDVIKQVQYALLEPASNQQIWNGTEMFTYNDVANAVQHRLNQFLSDTGILVSRSLVNVVSPPVGREILADNVIDVRRAAWVGSSPENYYKVLWREDERMLTAASQTWSVNAGTPEAYSIMAPPPLQLQLSPVPISNGQLELLTVDAITLTSATAATALGIPDDLTPAIKWGALADLFGNDGIARDMVRATYCEQRYQLYVQLARMLPVVIHAEINGVPLIPCTLQELETYSPSWENKLGTPTDIALAAPNMIALSKVPNDIFSITLDVVRRSPVPASDSTFVELGREQLDMILDYAESLALLKVAGPEWHATERQASNFIIQAITYNGRISAGVRASLAAAEQSQRQKQAIPRRTNGIGIGAMRAQ